jgi:hypothetical protein
MIRVQQLRRKAELARRTAAIPTQDGMLTDRSLLELADRLEEEATTRVEYLRRQAEADKPA